MVELLYRHTSVLVTGGAGFIGSHLVERLVTLGAQVTVLDDLSTGNLANLASVSHDITFVKGSVTDFETCLTATANKKIIFHLAAFVSVPKSLEAPYECHETNVEGTFNLLESARINGTERFVFSSSSAVYGATEKPCVETMPCNPESPYGFSKLIGELYCKQFAHNFGLDTICLRYFNVFGERQNPQGDYAAVVAKFKEQIHNNRPITIFGDGLQKRDFVPVATVVDANIQLGALPKEQLRGDVVNIGSGKSITLLELIDMLAQEHPEYAQQIRFAAARPGDLRYSQADCSKYQSVTDELAK